MDNLNENIAATEIRPSSETEPKTAKVRSEIFSLASPQEITERLVTKLTDLETNLDEKRWLLGKLELSEGADKAEIEQKIGLRIGCYLDQLNERERRLPEQQAAISKWLETGN